MQQRIRQPEVEVKEQAGYGELIRGNVNFRRLWVGNIVSLLGGTMRVDSAPQRGTAFVIELPLAQPVAAATDAPSRAGRLAHVGLRVLLVEDDQRVQEVLARWPVKTSVLDAYVSKVFPRGAVLGGTSRGNDRARQLGAHVIEASAISHGAYLALERVLETSDDYVRRRAAEFEGEAVEPNDEQQRFAEAVRWLARRVAGRVIRVRFFARDPNDAGLLEDATTDVDARVISFNVRGPLRFDDVLDPTTLGVVLHELAHMDTPEHGRQFIDRLQQLAGQTARLFAEEPGLADALRRGDPDRDAKGRN